MARYRKIDPRIWNDQKFSSFSERGKLLFFYILTHPNMTMLGMLRATPEGLFSELGIPSADCHADWQALCHAEVVKYDRHGLIRLPNFLKYNEPESPSVVKAWADVYDLLPECDLLRQAKSDIEEYLISKGKSWIQAYKHISKQPNGQTASQPAVQTAWHQEQEQEQEQDNKDNTNTSLSDANAELQEAASEQSEVEILPLEPEQEPEQATSNPKIPYDEIVSLYNRMCVPGCVKVRLLNPSRKTLIKQRATDMMKHWDGHGTNDLIECFTRLFTHVKNSDFLMGKTTKNGNHANWQCTFSWILKSENFVNILEGKYE